ncbi:tyrosine-type recombinase/integrase [Micromonospora sp. CPCC 205556]|uniref:tyrosine-type recombinase/integrase n=1 Tax=Micromonospora sp. CPCC 205556 TaxID=3122398 RepID=UPI002FF16689
MAARLRGEYRHPNPSTQRLPLVPIDHPAGCLRHVRLHDLRHTAASVLLAQGVPARVVMEILGHSQISVTLNIYAHVAPEIRREAASPLEGALWSGE